MPGRSISVSISPLSHSRVMLAAGSEQNRHTKRDNGSEADPPGEYQDGQPARLRVSSRSEKSGDAVRQTAQDGDNDETDNHGEDVSKIIAASLCEYSAEKNTQERPVSVTKNSEHDRDDPHIGMHDHKIGGGRRDGDHQNREPDRGPADSTKTLVGRRYSVDIGFIPISRETGSESVKSGAQRAHGSGENSCDEQSAQTDRHLVKNEMAERFVRRFRQRWIRVYLVIRPEQQTNAQKCEHDRYVGQP